MPFTRAVTKAKALSKAPSSVATITEGGRLLHIAGQTPRDDEGRTVAVGDAAGQMRQVLERIRSIVEDQGGQMSDICRMLIFVTDPKHMDAMMAVRHRYFSEPFPACTTVVTQLTNPDWLLEVEATAAL